jgi:hypothetical protein
MTTIMDTAIDAEFAAIATAMTGHLIEMESRIASGEVTHSGIVTLTRHLRSSLTIFTADTEARKHGTP